MKHLLFLVLCLVVLLLGCGFADAHGYGGSRVAVFNGGCNSGFGGGYYGGGFASGFYPNSFYGHRGSNVLFLDGGYRTANFRTGRGDIVVLPTNRVLVDRGPRIQVNIGGRVRVIR